MFAEKSASYFMSCVKMIDCISFPIRSFPNSVVVEVSLVKKHCCKMSHTVHASEGLMLICLCQNIDIQHIKGAANTLDMNIFSVRLG